MHKKRVAVWILVAAAAIVILIVRGAMYQVFPHEQVLVIQFGKVVRGPIDEPGLHFKNPFIQKVVRIDKRLIAWDGQPGRTPTKDKKNIQVDVYARWRIVDARLFYTSVQGRIDAGQKKLDDLVDAAVRNVVSSHDLIEVVRATNRALIYGADRQAEGLTPEQGVTIAKGRETLEELIRQDAAPTLRTELGIELVDVRIKRVNYVKNVRTEVYERMKSERQRIAARLESEANEYAQKILGDTEKQVAIIEGEAEQESARIRGDGDAKSIQVYADAVNQAPKFFAYLRLLDAYQKVIDSKTNLVLTTNSPFLKLLKETEPIRVPTTQPAGE